MTTPKNERKSQQNQDSSRSGMANQNPSQQHTQNPGQKRDQQGDPNNRGRHNPQGGSADHGKDPARQDSTKR